MSPEQIDMGLEESALERELNIRPCRAFKTEPCAGCGRQIVSAHDATNNRTIALEPFSSAYLEIGVRTDGRPTVAFAVNGHVRHACTPFVAMGGS